MYRLYRKSQIKFIPKYLLT